MGTYELSWKRRINSTTTNLKKYSSPRTSSCTTHTIQVRHGLIIVGTTVGAKTASDRSLSKAYNLLKDEENFSKVHCHVINPKSITMGQLYGMVDPQTSEWIDGVLAKIVQECARDQSPHRHWFMFDGPVDALWIENMNGSPGESGSIYTIPHRETVAGDATA